MRPSRLTPVMTTLAYIVRDGDVLLCHRVARDDDMQRDKYNGVGGHMERHEDPVSCVRREIMEETGLRIDAPMLRGTISWPGFGPAGEDHFAFVFRVDDPLGEPFTENNEGVLSWHPIDRMDDLPMWEGDRLFLPLVFDADPRLFHFVIPYHEGRPTGCTVVRGTSASSIPLRIVNEGQ